MGRFEACVACGALTLMAGCAAQGANTPPATLPAVSIPIEPELLGGNNEATPTPEPSPPEAKTEAPHFAPDPEPLRTAQQYDLTFRFERGEVKLTGVKKRTFPQPLSTERRLGRFAVELWIGHELIERVRFDFPLLAAPEHKEKGPGTSSLEAGLTVTQQVLVPADERATRAVLVDRATGEQRDLAWPPSDTAGAAPALPVRDPAPAPTEPAQATPAQANPTLGASTPPTSAPAAPGTAPAPAAPSGSVPAAKPTPTH